MAFLLAPAHQAPVPGPSLGSQGCRRREHWRSPPCGRGPASGSAPVSASGMGGADPHPLASAGRSQAGSPRADICIPTRSLDWSPCPRPEHLQHRVGAGPACSRASGPQSFTLLPSQSPESQEASPGHLPGRTLRPPLQRQKWTLSPNSKAGAPQKLDSQAPSHPMTAQKGGGSHHPEGTWQQTWWEGYTLNFSLHFLLSMPPAGRPPTRAQGLSRQETCGWPWLGSAGRHSEPPKAWRVMSIKVLPGLSKSQLNRRSTLRQTTWCVVCPPYPPPPPGKSEARDPGH